MGQKRTTSEMLFYKNVLSPFQGDSCHWKMKMWVKNLNKPTILYFLCRYAFDFSRKTAVPRKTEYKGSAVGHRKYAWHGF